MLQLDRSPSERYEAVYVFKRKAVDYCTIADGFNHLIYYTGDSPTGPFSYRGELMDKYGGNNHHAHLATQETCRRARTLLAAYLRVVSVAVTRG